jgi:CD109 antigen
VQGDAGIHWEPYPVETTAYAALALLAAGRPEATPAIEFIASQRGSMGGFGSTQDTVIAFRALSLAALDARRDVNGSIDLIIDGVVVNTFTVNETNYDLLQTFDFSSGTTGQLIMRGTGKVGYQVARHFNLPGEIIPPPRDMLIRVEYLTDHVAVDDIVDVAVTLRYTGPRERTNMVIADVGVPTGFAAVQESLDALIEAKTVSRVEQALRKIIFYIPELVKDTEMRFVFQVKALFPVRAAPVASVAYDYYEPDARGIDPGTGISVSEPVFRRGDANRDQNLDIADPVAVLNYLFANGALVCLDAADANDDGRLNVADPVYLLAHLFATGAAPPPPAAEGGPDPTPDELDCRS